MEIFGIVFAVPAAFIASAVYLWFIWKFVRPHPNLRRAVRVLSLAVLGLIVVEIIAVASIGAVQLRRAIGPAFYVGHLFLFVGAVPALANALTLPARTMGWARVILICMACAACALPVVLLQYGVSEALYGVDGDNGPFSAPR